jgi:hypothetical protein
MGTDMAVAVAMAMVAALATSTTLSHRLLALQMFDKDYQEQIQLFPTNSRAKPGCFSFLLSITCVSVRVSHLFAQQCTLDLISVFMRGKGGGGSKIRRRAACLCIMKKMDFIKKMKKIEQLCSCGRYPYIL